MRHGPLRFVFPGMIAVVLSLPTTAILSATTPPEAGVGQAGGYKVGDKVQVNTGFGWVAAQILKVDGNRYYVHTGAGDIWKYYPAEVRGAGGALTAQDRANGHYQLHDKVQVHVDGHWESGEIVTTMGQEYQIKLAGNRETWAGPENMRFAGAAAAAPPAAQGGVPPKTGMTSCAGKIEGRYSNSGGLGSLTIVFRSGKATLADPSGQGEVLECWMSGDKIILHKPGQSNLDMPIAINNDGTLDTPLGETKKKGN